jgi:putative PIN family toxin of toxin-antitoxin system
MKKLRVTLDTNVLVSGIILERGIPYSILELWRRGAFLLITSNELIDEVVEVLHRVKTVKNYDIPIEKVASIGKLLKQKSRVVIPTPLTQPISLRDKKDAFILETAMTGKAEYLITGDKDLLSLCDQKEVGPLVIMTPQQFLEFLRGTAEDRF